jgi:hypothetical protein
MLFPFRAADLCSLVHRVHSPLDRVAADLTLPVTIMMFMTKTAVKTCGDTNLWRSVTIHPLIPAELMVGLNVESSVAADLAATCCLVRAMRAIRRLLLPTLRLRPIVELNGVNIYSDKFFPFPSSKFEEDIVKNLRFITVGTVQSIVIKAHNIIEGLPPFISGTTVRHHRHVVLTLMRRVGCSEEAQHLSAHTGDTTFQQSYKIATIHPDFALRLGLLSDSIDFQNLHANARLLL